MPSRTLAGSAALLGDWDAHEGGWKAGMDDNLLWLSVLTQGRVISQILAEPGAPAQGDVYLLSAAHATRPNQLAAYDEGTWHYRAPLAGWRFYNAALSAFVRFDGTSWITDDYLTAIGGGGDAATDRVVTGMSVVYSGSGLTFNMTAGTFYLGGILYSAAAQSVTLDAADPVDPRIDTLFVYGSGVFDKITGTPDPDPQAPEVDVETQLFLLSITVPAAAVDLTGQITDEIIFDEGAEWAPTVTGAHINAASAVDPSNGAVAIEATAAVSGEQIDFDTALPIAFDNSGNLLLKIKSKAFWNGGLLDLRFFQGANRKGNRIVIRDGVYGFDSSITADYQQIAIPKYRFQIEPGTGIDGLRIKVSSAGGIGFFLDEIVAQTPDAGTTVVSVTSGITQDDADLRYFQLNSGATDNDIWEGSLQSAVVTPDSLFDAMVPQTLVDGANVTMDGDLGINWEWDIAGNRNMLNPINMKPGQSGVIRIKQDATGNRVPVWGSDWEFPGGVATGGVLSTAANAVDYLSYTISNSGKVRAVLSKAFAH